jgi:hypothetical protein
VSTTAPAGGATPVGARRPLLGARAEVELVSDRSEGPYAGVHRFSALELIARGPDQVPERDEAMVRYAGAYATQRPV